MAKHNRLSAQEVEQIRDMYVQGHVGEDGVRKYPTLRELAEKFNSSAATLSRHKNDGNWDDHRAVFETKRAEDRDNKKRSEMIEQAAEFDSNILILAKSLQNEIGKVMQKMSRKRQSDPDEMPTMGASQISQLANALNVLQRTGRLALGESTENTNVTTNAQQSLDEAFNIVEQLRRGADSGVQKLH